jgi:CelD/BcsL family acetyltransferase involved in cellulose biosynthesis
VARETDTLIAADLGAAEQAAWRELGDQAAEPNPFYEPEFMMPAFRRLGLRGAGLRIVREGDEWIACLPVHAAPAGSTAVVGLRHPYVPLCTPLIRRDRLEQGTQGLLGPDRRRAQVVVMPSMGANGPVDLALEEAAASMGLRRAWERRILRAAARPRAERPRPRRRELERNRRRLEAALDGPLTLEDRAGSDAAVVEFLALEAAGWKGRAGTALASSSRHGAFFADVLAAFHGRGRLRLMALSAGSRTVAMSCELLDGDSMFGLKTCYDEELRKFGPGIQLFDTLVQRFHDDGGLAMYDSCSDPYAKVVNEIFGDRRAIVSFISVPRRLARPVRSGLHAARALRGRIRPMPAQPAAARSSRD